MARAKLLWPFQSCEAIGALSMKAHGANWPGENCGAFAVWPAAVATGEVGSKHCGSVLVAGGFAARHVGLLCRTPLSQPTHAH